MCINYRLWNKQTIKNHYLFPRNYVLLDRLGHANDFSKMDPAQGYHQIAMVEDSVSKTVFCTHLGQCDYVVRTFGLSNAPNTFQRLSNRVFAKEIKSFILVYMDNILILIRSIGEH